MATVGISLAAGLIASTVSKWLSPTQTIQNGGLSDLSAPKSNYGIVIPQCWGTLGLTGNLIWATDKIERTQKKRRGKGGGGVVEENKSYYANLATLFAWTPNNPALEFEQIYFNGKLVYSIYGDAETLANSNDFANQYMRFYLGTSTQIPDPLLENTIPVATYDYGLPHDPTERASAIASLGLNPNDAYTSPYRYRVYSVCEDLPLAEWGNNFPAIKAVIRFHDNCTLGTIITDICAQSGLQPEQYELIGMNIPVTGFYIDRIMSASSALKLLQQAYFFDIVDGGDKLKFIAKSFNRSILTIPLEDLAAHSSGSQIPATYTREPEFIDNLPESVEVNYINPNLKYQSDNVKSRSQVSKTKKKESYQFPLILTEDEALAIAENLLHQWFLESETIKFTLPPAYLFLEPGDRISIDGSVFQLTKIRVGANLLMDCEGKIFSPATISNLIRSTAVYSGGYNSPINQVISQGNTTLCILDIPLIEDKDSDYGLYVTATGGINWKECSIYGSNDNSRYEFIAKLIGKGAIGTLQTSMDSNSTSFTVILDSGELESVSESDLDAGLNKMLVGNEILQFQNSNLTAPNTYDVGTLRRGVRGTENYLSHSIGERIILLSGDNAVIERIPGSFADVGQVRYFKSVSPGQSLDQVNPVTLTVAAKSLNPYAPVNPTAIKDDAGNIYLSWDRRDRHAGERTDYENLPLSETTEQWEVDIVQLNSVVRTLNGSSNLLVYGVADQVTDFGSPQSSISVRIYQLSSVVGRGEPLISNLTPTLGTPPQTSQTGNGFTGFTEVSANRSLQNDDLGKILTCDTNAGDITLTLDPANINVSNFNCTILNNGINKVLFSLVSGNDFFARSNQLASYNACSIFYAGSNQWYGLGGLTNEVGDFGFPAFARLTPYTIIPSDQNKELVFDAQSGVLLIPNLSSGFVDNWVCLIALDNTGDIEIKRVDGSTTGLIFSGFFNHLKTQGTVTIRHRGNNIWKIEGGLE